MVARNLVVAVALLDFGVVASLQVWHWDATRCREILPAKVTVWLSMAVNYSGVSSVGLTRQQLAARVGLSEPELDSCIRLGAVKRTLVGSRAQPALFSESECTISGVVADAHRLGLRGQGLLRMRQAVEPVLGDVAESFSGWVVVAGSRAALVANLSDLVLWNSVRQPTVAFPVPAAHRGS